MSSYTTLPPNAQTQRCLRLQNHCHFSSWMPQKKKKSILLLGSKDSKRNWAVVPGKGIRAVGLFWSCGHAVCFDSDFQEGAGREDVMGRGTQSCGDCLCWRHWLLNEVPSRWGNRLPVYLTDSCLCHFSFPPVLHQLENWCCSPPVSKGCWKMTKMLAFVCYWETEKTFSQ